MGTWAPTTGDDLVEPAAAAEDAFLFTALTPATAPTIRRLAELEPSRLALMHGPSFEGDGGDQLRRLADHYEHRLTSTMPAAVV
jgi:hypothetical protein